MASAGARARLIKLLARPHRRRTCGPPLSAWGGRRVRGRRVPIRARFEPGSSAPCPQVAGGQCWTKTREPQNLTMTTSSTTSASCHSGPSELLRGREATPSGIRCAGSLAPVTGANAGARASSCEQFRARPRVGRAALHLALPRGHDARRGHYSPSLAQIEPGSIAPCPQVFPWQCWRIRLLPARNSARPPSSRHASVTRDGLQPCGWPRWIDASSACHAPGSGLACARHRSAYTCGRSGSGTVARIRSVSCCRRDGATASRSRWHVSA